jgi:hypothetical protein
MPRVTSITFGKTFNDGNFESTRLDLTAELGLNESFDDAFADLIDKLNELREMQLDAYEPKRRKR